MSTCFAFYIHIFFLPLLNGYNHAFVGKNGIWESFLCLGQQARLIFIA